MSMEGVENVELHAGHHEVVQWLGLTFNLDTLIATWVTMAIVILITVLATRGRKLVPVGLQNIVESILEGLEGQLAPNLGRHWPMVSSLLFTFFLFIFVGNELGLMPTLKALTAENQKNYFFIIFRSSFKILCFRLLTPFWERPI